MKSERSAQPAPPPVRLPEQLRCPITGKPLELEEGGHWVRVVGEPLRYPVRGGIPVLVAPAAEKPG
ncbi:MAG: hypothetical protein NCW75_06825 [Phycisphaera sp.]|nr:MAG: hypothetical protein NCW75_06825 [Phycisphaera sp.]